jgi:RNA polymerase sigma factor (sigma-70 family)
MPAQMNEVVDYLRSAILRQDDAGLTDGQLLGYFVEHRDEAAVTALVRRHGPMVWGVCLRILQDHDDAQDAFQATFLVLIRKAASVKQREIVANWLYGVARQTARKARAMLAKRRARERQVSAMPEPAVAESDTQRDVQQALDQELGRLPDKYRIAIVLCDLEGRTRKEVARRLGLPEGTVAGRLTRGRALLAKRLARHGLAVSAGTLAIALAQETALASVPTAVQVSTIKAVTSVAAGQAVSGLISAHVTALAEGVMKAMLLDRLKTKVVAPLVVLALLALGGGLCLQPGGMGLVNAQTTEIQKTVQENLDLKRLQGTWTPHLLVTTEGAEDYPLAGRALYFHGSEFVRMEGKRTVASGTFKVEEGYLRLTVKDRTPWDLEAPEIKDKTQYAFKLEGDVLTLCYSTNNKGRAGDLTPGAGRQVVVYRRQGK